MFGKRECLPSQKCTTQEDLLAIVMYTLATALLINMINTHDHCQVWHADDSEKLDLSREWWKRHMTVACVDLNMDVIPMVLKAYSHRPKHQ